jgi:hypothetical protein
MPVTFDLAHALLPVGEWALRVVAICHSIRFLDPAGKLAVGEIAPTLIDVTGKLNPVAFDAIPVHFSCLMLKTGAGHAFSDTKYRCRDACDLSASIIATIVPAHGMVCALAYRGCDIFLQKRQVPPFAYLTRTFGFS